MSLHYLGKHEPGNCVFSVCHRHVSSPGECGWLWTEPVSCKCSKWRPLAFPRMHAATHILQYGAFWVAILPFTPIDRYRNHLRTLSLSLLYGRFCQVCRLRKNTFVVFPTKRIELFVTSHSQTVVRYNRYTIQGIVKQWQWYWISTGWAS